MAYWACAQLMPQREKFALQMLARARFQVYAPRLREMRTVRDGRRRQREVALFPGYTFLIITNGWYAARWCPGVRDLIRNGDGCPAVVPDAVIDAIRRRERDGAIELPRRTMRLGDRVQILAGPFRGQLALYAGMSGLERCAVLLKIFGAATRVTLAERDIEVLDQTVGSACDDDASAG
jgi:transcription antitermination factor NusG